MSIIKSFLHLLLLILVTPLKHKITLLKLGISSNAQLHQDLFALLETNFKYGGFFVEFGAVDGLYLSNSLILEKAYGWQGILVEPNRSSYSKLLRNRPRSRICSRCVWTSSGETVDFNWNIDPALSGIVDCEIPAGENNRTYPVLTVSLADLLLEFKAPDDIDFLSIDTEGTEWDIIREFDFTRYNIRVVCIEHNYGPNRQAVFQKMISEGYRRKYKFLSRFDDWYVKC